MRELGPDLQRAFSHGQAWEPLSGERVFLTGGTGFFGCWLIESFLWALKAGLARDCRMTVLTRNEHAFLDRWPDLAARIKKSSGAVEFHRGDIADFPFPEG